MILWIVLFLLIVAISFVLAIRSMKDYQEIPQQTKEEYSLFLIKRISGFDTGILGSILEDITKNGLIISIERLFKGNFTTLTIFGPKSILKQFSNELGLVELEDYATKLESSNISTWEIGVKDTVKFNPDDLNNIFNGMPKLDAEDQFFWQVVIGKNQTQIRAALYSKDSKKHTTLVPLLQSLQMGSLNKIPKPFSTSQMMDFYRLRTLSRDSTVPVLTPEGIMRLLKV